MDIKFEELYIGGGGGGGHLMPLFCADRDVNYGCGELLNQLHSG